LTIAQVSSENVFMVRRSGRVCVLLLILLALHVSIPVCGSAASQTSQESMNVRVRDSAASGATGAADLASKKVAALPDKTAILHAVVSAGQEHKLAVSVVVIFCLAESALIVVLVVQRRRRRKAEEAVRKSGAKYRSLYESMMDGFVLVGMDGPIKEFNESYRSMTGYTQEELLQITYQDLTPDRWHHYEREIVEKQVLVRGYSDVYEKEYRRKDGTVFPIELRAFLLKDGQGNNIGMWAIVRDVTERRRAEEALNERLQFEHLLSDLSARFVNIPPDRVDAEIEHGLRQVLEFFQVERCGLIQTSPDNASWQVTHVAVVEDVPSVPLRTQLPSSIYPWAYDKLIRKGEVVAFSSLDELPAEADVDKRTWKEWGICSNLVIPIMIGEPGTYVIAIDSVRGEYVWPEDLIPRTRLLGEIFANALERKQIRLQLEKRLRFEQLTSDLSSRFVNLPSDKVDSEINKWLRSITEFFEADRCSLGLFSEDATRLVRFLEYHFPGAQPAAEYVSKEQMPWYFEQLLQGNPVVMNRIKDLPPEAEKEQGFCVVRGMKSVLSVPMASGGKILGSCALVSTRAERVWQEDLVHRFRFISEIFANALAGKRADQALRESEAGLSLAAEEWKTTFDSITDVVMILDKEHRVIRVNAPALSFFGHPEEELLGTSCYALMHGTNEPFPTCPMTKVRMTKQHEEADLYDEERQAWFHVTVDPILDQGGQIIRAVHTVKDITARKRAESEAFAARRELLRTERLLRMGELTASLAHELNQPLTSILSNARAALRFIQSGSLDLAEFKEILEDIAQDDKRASDIIRSLRSMVRPEEGERVLVALNDVLREAVSLFHSESVIRNISVEMNLADELFPVMIDKVLILQVLVNLLMNAAESMGGGVSGDREILMASQAGAEGTVRVAVSDAGPGIEAEDLNKVFDPFFTTKRSGLGMGLSLSRSIIESHGGRIWAENNEGRGVTFYFDLPAAR
jgi:two-component system, LuxR family, sensor kinase FixL